jgi:hypothetical protein
VLGQEHRGLPGRVASTDHDNGISAAAERLRLGGGVIDPSSLELSEPRDVETAVLGASCDHDSPRAYQLAGLVASHAPADAAETELVTSMAEALWLARRATRLQDRCLELIGSDDAEAAKTARADLNLYLRYQTTHERSYQRYAAELRKLQSDRSKAEIGFVSQKHKEQAEQRQQERHETALAFTKSRLDHQLMKNRLLLVDVKDQDERDEKKKRYEAFRKSVEEQRNRKK